MSRMPWRVHYTRDCMIDAAPPAGSHHCVPVKNVVRIESCSRRSAARVAGPDPQGSDDHPATASPCGLVPGLADWTHVPVDIPGLTESGVRGRVSYGVRRQRQ